MNKKFYEKKFDNATQVKLDVFRLYLQKWLPVFTSKGEEVSIYDFFAGPGKRCNRKSWFFIDHR